MTSKIHAESTYVPIDDGEDVEILPGQPWPSAYRGSRYSLLDSRRRDRGTVAQWQYRDLRAQFIPPDGLLDAMRTVGKSRETGKGSFRITADGEVLTKVHADEYPHVGDAPVSRGWIPIYLGRLSGRLALTDIDIDPALPHNEPVAVWEGFPFNHGERWAVSVDGTLIWTWQNYRFESSFDHSELIARYRRYRNPPGRLYINEYGHVFVNIEPENVPKAEQSTVTEAYTRWQQDAERNERTAALRLVNRRLRATAPNGDPDNGLLPMYIGYLGEFDGGTIPKPVVDAPQYYRACGTGEGHNQY